MSDHEMPSDAYRRLMKLVDVDAQSECTAAEFIAMQGGTANNLLRNLDDAAPKPARSHPELDWRGTVVDAAKFAGWKVYWTWNSIHSPAGFPDLVMVKPPRIIFAELKSETGRTTRSQREWLDLLCGVTGATVRVWRPSDWPRVLEMLQR